MLVDFFDDQGSFSVTDFCTPPVGNPLAGKLFVSAAFGANYIDGDQLRFGPDDASMINLYGPNNNALNFYQSQINSDINGTLTTTGTFGTSNQPVNTNDVLPSGRFGWDKTMIRLDSLLTNQQQSASIQMICQTITPNRHDVHNMVTMALQIDLMSANMTGVKTITPTVASVGDTLNYSITLTSTGPEPAHDITVKDLLGGATNLSYVANSLQVDGVGYAGNPITGINLPGPYPQNSSISITFKVHVDAMPVPNPFTSAADVTYNYIPGCSMDAVGEPFSTNSVTVTIQGENVRGVPFI